MTTEKPTYSKMKSWADHCSSDEESDDGLHPARLAGLSSGDNDNGLSYDESIEHISVNGDDDDDDDAVVGDIGHGGNDGGGRRNYNNNNNNQQKEIPFPEWIDLERIPEDFPPNGPYVAYVQNLSYRIDTPMALAEKLEGMTRWRYHKRQEVKVTSAKFGPRKGTAFISFATPQELMLFLNLDDGYSSLNSRILRIQKAKQTSNNNNRQGSNIDGSQFRGGRYAKTNNNNDTNNSSTASTPTARPSLKLAPRTIPVEGSVRSSSNSSIFGDAKPRDEYNWMMRKKEEGGATEINKDPAANAEQTNTDASNNVDESNENEEAISSGVVADAPSRDGENNNGRGKVGGRGGERKQQSSKGKGGGRTNRGGKRDGNRKNGDRKTNNQSGKDADGWEKGSSSHKSQTAPMPVLDTGKKKVTTVKNSFAALGFDSDSD